MSTTESAVPAGNTNPQPTAGPSQTAPSSSKPNETTEDGTTKKKQPICVVVIGMAGSVSAASERSVSRNAYSYLL
jgi:hypothetical protein